MRRVAEEFMLMQVGICLFHQAEDGVGYVARPLNFYVFPSEVCTKKNAPPTQLTGHHTAATASATAVAWQPMPTNSRCATMRGGAATAPRREGEPRLEGVRELLRGVRASVCSSRRPLPGACLPPQGSQRRMVMSTSTAYFHVSNSMDFNRWIGQGVPFVDAACYSSMLSKLEEEVPFLVNPFFQTSWRRRGLLSCGAVAHHARGRLPDRSGGSSAGGVSARRLPPLRAA